MVLKMRNFAVPAVGAASESLSSAPVRPPVGAMYETIV